VHACAAVSSTTIEIGSPEVAIARSEPARATVVRPLGLWGAVSIIAGVVIGAGIYETVPLVLSNLATPGQAMGVWLAGGVLSLIGATCYAELASTYPRSGGDYGFLFGWAQLAVILTGSIGMMAYVSLARVSRFWSGGSARAGGGTGAALGLAMKSGNLHVRRLETTMSSWRQRCAIVSATCRARWRGCVLGVPES
jgi:hypothetical protein